MNLTKINASLTGRKRFYFIMEKIQNRKNKIIVSETEIELTREEFDFLFCFEILIVLLIVILDMVSSGSGSLRLFLEAVLDGLLHWPYNEDNLY